MIGVPGGQKLIMSGIVRYSTRPQQATLTALSRARAAPIPTSLDAQSIDPSRSKPNRCNRSASSPRPSLISKIGQPGGGRPVVGVDPDAQELFGLVHLAALGQQPVQAIGGISRSSPWKASHAKRAPDGLLTVTFRSTRIIRLRAAGRPALRLERVLVTLAGAVMH